MIRVLVLLLAIFFIGCSEKQYFKPSSIEGKFEVESSLSSSIIQSNKNGAVLKDGTLIAKDGIYKANLKSEYLFLNKSGDYILVGDYTNNNLYFLNTDGKILKTFEFPYMPISANLKDNFLAVVLSDNSSLIWDTNTNEELFSDKSSVVYAINSKSASPLFLDSSVVFPTLDGKLLLVSLDSFKVLRTITLSSGGYFSNIIFLDLNEGAKSSGKLSLNKEPNLIVATNAKVLSIYNGKQFSYEANINDIVYNNDKIYIISLEGEVIELDLLLNELHKKKFQFANLSSLIIGDSIYTLESQGYLIKIDKNDFKDSIYKIGIGEYKQSFYIDDTIYYDDNIIKVK